MWRHSVHLPSNSVGLKFAVVDPLEHGPVAHVVYPGYVVWTEIRFGVVERFFRVRHNDTLLSSKRMYK